MDVSFNDVEEYIKYGERVNVRTADAAVGVDRLEAFYVCIYAIFYKTKRFQAKA